MNRHLLRPIRGRLIFAVLASTAAIAATAFQWSIIDRITPFLMFPLIVVVGGFFVGTAIASATCLFKYRKIGRVAALPLGIQLLAASIVYFVPFTELWLKADFFLYKKAREEIVEKVHAGSLVSNVQHNSSLIALKDSYPTVSMGGNEIVVETHDGLKYVFFYTFRGILDNYSGFIYVPEGGRAEAFSDLKERERTQILPLEENWFYVSHH